MTLIVAAKQAFKVLENWCDPDRSYNERNIRLDTRRAITNLRAAIEAAEKVEPVGVVVEETDCTDYFNSTRKIATVNQNTPVGTELYTHPAPEPEGWQQITEELDLLDALLEGWPISIATADGFRAVRSIRKLLAAAPKPEGK